MKGFILDLRNNPGGLLTQAIGLVNLFVDKGVIVSQKEEILKMKRNLKQLLENENKTTISCSCK